MMTKIFDLAFEIDGDTIELEQEAGCGEVHRITLHPIHLRMLTEQAGLLAPTSNLEADRTIARLCRQMRILYERINQLDDWLNQAAQKGHEDLELETTYSFATWELADEFVRDLPISNARCNPQAPAAVGITSPATRAGLQGEGVAATGQLPFEGAQQ